MRPRTNRCLLILLVALVLNGSLSLATDGTDAGRPNIIIVMADDMGFSDLGCYGGEIRTPVIDRLAKEGLRFSQFYNCALCGPSRASLMTGCYPWDVGQAPGNSIFANLRKNCATVMELLKANGYTTCAVGRLDMVTAEDWHDPVHIARCADRFLGSASGGPGNYFKQAKGTPWFRDGKRYDRPVGAYSTDLISSFVTDFIEESAESDKPFFVYVSHYAPHWPLQANEEDIAPYRDLYEKNGRTTLMHARLMRLVETGLIPEGTTLHDSMLNATGKGSIPVSERLAMHAAMVESIDRSLADTMTALKKADKLENTLILVLSDNGASHQMAYNRDVLTGMRPGSVETFINHGPAVASLSNTPFRNYKVSNYEGGIASPLIAWWPHGLKGKGRISHHPCHIADIMPTCLELANATYPSKFQDRKLIPLAGQSFLSDLRNNRTDQESPRVMVWPKAVRDGDWKLVMENKVGPQLYSISQDRNEKKNLAAEFPTRVLELQQIHAKTYAQR
ncbi:MAG: sulfatase-like hydrolase/transferase [Pirellulaceae bacterium]|nr:sulfatase-like hydrolase/transferase [Pirellulaceae bacterium]HJN11210.1 sulfatase-like hydrolase/transferase [Pirellulaceae bacterium]